MKMKETPIADTSGASFGAFRNGRYTILSTATLSPPQNRPQSTTSSATPSHVVAMPPPPMPNADTSESARQAPSMIRSPWAKLISRMMP